MTRDLITVESLRGAKLPHVTTILDVLMKKGLINWAARMAVTYIKDKVIDLIKFGLIDFDELQVMDLDKIIEDARDYHNKKAAEAADKGKRVHEAIERWLRAKDEEEIEVDEDLQKPFKAFLTWWEENNIDPILIEEKVWSLDQGGFAGVPDVIGYVGKGPERKMYVIDFKTGKAIYDDFTLQLAAYFFAARQSQGLEVEVGGILRLDQITGEPEFHVFSMAEIGKAYARFLCLVSYWHKTHREKIELEDWYEPPEPGTTPLPFNFKELE